MVRIGWVLGLTQGGRNISRCSDSRDVKFRREMFAKRNDPGFEDLKRSVSVVERRGDPFVLNFGCTINKVRDLGTSQVAPQRNLIE